MANKIAMPKGNRSYRFNKSLEIMMILRQMF